MTQTLTNPTALTPASGGSGSRRTGAISSRRRGSGFTLVEVLLAMGILAVGLAAVASIYPIAVLQQRRALDEMNSTIVGQNVLQTLQAMGQSSFPAATSTSFTTAERVMFVDGVVTGTTLTSASGAFDFDDSALPANPQFVFVNDRIILIGNKGSYSTTASAVSGGTITIPAAANVPANNPANPQDGYYTVIVYPPDVRLPWVASEPVDRGTVSVNARYPARRNAYLYSIAYRRQNANGPVEVAIFVSRRVTHEQQTAIASIDTTAPTTYPPQTTSGIVQSEPITSINAAGVVTFTGARPGTAVGVGTWPRSLNWASDRNQYILGYQDAVSPTDEPSVFRVIAVDDPNLTNPATASLDVEQSYSHNRVLFLPQGAIGITTGVIK